MTRMATRTADSDVGSMTPSEPSDADDRSERDSDYESDEEEQHKEQLNLQWTGYGKKTPVILFCPSAMLQKKNPKRTVGERYHLTYKFGNSECKVVRNIFNFHGFHEVHPNSSDFNIIWTGGHLKPFTLRSMTEFQKINHFPRSYELTRKDRLFKNVQRMQQIKGAKHFDFIPSSFILPSEYQDFCASFLKEKGLWIVKPVASSRGRGVFLCNHPDQVPLDENLIVCKYIHNPLLIDGFKFDVRLYVCVTSYDPLSIYLFEEGLTRFATVKYEKGNRFIRNQCMHLTNYSVNKKSDDYVKNDDPDVEDYGNKWSLGALLRYLRSHGKDTAGLMMRIEDVVIKTILSVELPIATACKMFMPFRGNCFELYGFDVLVDDNLKPWILEVNLSPSLACDSPLDLKIKTNMICDLFSLSGVICHDPMMRTLQQSRRNQEVTAKIAARAKSARYRPSSASSLRQRPQSANSVASSAAGNANKNSNHAMAGLNSEEIKILRRIKEEDQRKGGWVRIFPTADSWDLYSSFLQFSSSHNLMLHSRLYPERHKSTNPTSKAVASTSVGQRARSAYANIGGHSLKTDHEYAECYAQAILRTKQYERKLGTARRRNRNRNRNKKKENKVRPKLAQGVVEEDEDEDKEDAEQSDDNNNDDNVNVRGDDSGSGSDTVDNGHEEKNVIEVEKHSKNEPATSSSTTQVSKPQPPEKDPNLEKLPPKPPPQATNNKKPETKTTECKDEEETSEKSPQPEEVPPPPPPIEPKYNVVAMLQKGQTLSKCQARSAFAMYLIRVQQRLISETSPSNQDDSDALNEQMDLVLRFLKRAAVNLQQPFKVVVPSRKLPLNDRRRILAKQLGDFVHIYNKELKRSAKETDHLNNKQQQEKKQGKISEVHPGSVQNDNVCEHKFDKFVNTASEGDLEEVLTTYTKINKSASIFLGGNPKHSSSDITQPRPSSNASNQARPVVVSVKEPRTSTILPNRQSASHQSSILQNRPASSMSTQSASLANSETSLAKRRDSDISIVEVSAQKVNGWDDLPKTVNSTTTATASRPSTASLSGDAHMRTYQTPSQSSYANAVHIYTQKLTANRPRSASSGGPKPVTKPGLNRPMSAVSRSSTYNPYATTDPTVDSYNDQAIHDALQRLAMRQQARQYSAHSGTSVIGDEGRSRPTSAKTGQSTSETPHYVRSNSAVDNLTYVIGQGSSNTNLMSHQNSDYKSETLYRVPSNSGLKSESDKIQTNSSVYTTDQSKVQRSLSVTDSVKYNTNNVITEDYSRSRPPTGQGHRPADIRSAQGTRRPVQSNVNLQNANATFNSFIEDSKGGHWHNDLALAYNQVTGVLPNNYHTPSQSSKQFQLMQQQALKQESKALLEQSKAKHQAMVAQAHAVQKSIQQQKRPVSREVESAVQKYAPKPPIQPSHTRKVTGSHRVQRMVTTQPLEEILDQYFKL